MHTQADTSPRGPIAPATVFPAAVGLGLYVLTLSVEVLLGASIRWLLVFIPAAIVATVIPFGLSAHLLAGFAAAAPLLWSALAICRPGRGTLWRRSCGARKATSEECDALQIAAEILAIPEAPICWILDHPLPEAGVRGTALVVSRPVLESESLPAVLGHELGHLRSLDGRLTEALDRLRIWDDPQRPREEDKSTSEEPGLQLGALRWLIRLAGGGVGESLLAPLWAAYWRSREFAADAHAAALGQADDLAEHLADFEQPLDFACPSLPFNRSQHPSVAHRIERLRAWQAVSE